MAIFIDEATVRKLLTMPEAIEEVERAFIARARGKAFDIPRRRTRMPGGHLHILQGGAPELNLIGYKAYYIQPDRSRTSLLHLINREQGDVEAIIDSDARGQIRTGAATAVAARALARQDAQVLGLFGSGRHAMTQLEAVAAVRALREVKVFGRDAARLAAFCETMQARIGVAISPNALRGQ